MRDASSSGRERKALDVSTSLVRLVRDPIAGDASSRPAPAKDLQRKDGGVITGIRIESTKLKIGQIQTMVDRLFSCAAYISITAPSGDRLIRIRHSEGSPSQSPSKLLYKGASSRIASSASSSALIV